MKNVNMLIVQVYLVLEITFTEVKLFKSTKLCNLILTWAIYPFKATSNVFQINFVFLKFLSLKFYFFISLFILSFLNFNCQTNNSLFVSNPPPP